jgi:hypothetical protein
MLPLSFRRPGMGVSRGLPTIPVSFVHTERIIWSTATLRDHRRRARTGVRHRLRSCLESDRGSAATRQRVGVFGVDGARLCHPFEMELSRPRPRGRVAAAHAEVFRCKRWQFRGECILGMAACEQVGFVTARPVAADFGADPVGEFLAQSQLDLRRSLT